jgi:nitrite reductase (NADH) small subunit
MSRDAADLSLVVRSTELIDLGSIEDVLSTDRAVVTVPATGTLVLILRTTRGVFAFENRCPHLGSSLADAEVRGRRLTCPAHGYQYDLASGQCVRGRLGPRRLTTYPLRIERGRVWLVFPARAATAVEPLSTAGGRMETRHAH